MSENRKVKNRIISLMVVFIVVFCMLPMPALADSSGAVTLLVDQTTGNDNADRREGAVYKTINGAVAAAQDGDIIALSANFTVDSGFAVDMSGKTLTFDFAGYTVYCGGNAGFKCSGDADLTIIDGSAGKTGALVMTKNASIAGLYVYGAARVSVKGGYIDGTKCTGNPTTRPLAVWNCGVDAYVLLDNGRYGGYVFGNSLNNSNPLAFIRFTPEQLARMGDNYLGMLNPGWYGYELGEGQISLTEDLVQMMVIVESGKSLTIDLNGHNLVSNSYNAYISDGACLTVKNTGACNDTCGRIYCSKEGASTHNFFNAGTLILEGNIHIINQMTDTRFAPVYITGANSVLTVEEGVTIDSAGCTVLNTSNAHNSNVTINGGIFNGGVTPIQILVGSLTINGGSFNGSGNPSVMSGIFAGDIFTPSNNVSITHINNSVITARDSGIFLDPNVDTDFIVNNTTLNKNSSVPATYGILNLSGKNIVISGKDTYFNCTTIYQTIGERNGATYEGTGSLSITAGVYSVDPTSYVDTNKYIVLPYREKAGYFIVLPRLAVGSDSTAEVMFAAGSASTDTMTDTVDVTYAWHGDRVTDTPEEIRAAVDPENILGDMTAGDFSISSSQSDNTPIPGVTVTGYNASTNKVTIQIQKDVIATSGYLWAKGACIGEISIVKLVSQEGNISGTVFEGSNKVDGATVRLMNGTTQIGNELTTSSDGSYRFYSVKYGVYSLIVTNNNETVTVPLVLNAPALIKDIMLPDVNGNQNTVVEVKADTPNSSADLNVIFDYPPASQDDKGVTADDKEVVNNGGTVEIKLIVEKLNTPADANKIKELADDGKADFLYVDLSIMKTVTPLAGVATETNLKELNDIIEVSIEVPAEYRNADLRILRIHEGIAEELLKTPNSYGEYFTLNSDYSIVTLYIKRFSTFALSNGAASATSPNTGDTGSAPWILLLLVSGIGLLGTTLYIKKKGYLKTNK